MGIGERIGNTLEMWAGWWGDRFGNWIGRVVGAGVMGFEDHIGQKMVAKLKPTLDQLEAQKAIPSELQPIFDELKEPTGEIAGFLARAAGGSLVNAGFGAILDWLLRPLIWGMTSVPHFYLAKPEVLIGLYRRHMIGEGELKDLMKYNGIPGHNVDQLLKLGEVRFPSEIVGPMWLRNKEAYSVLWDDVRQLGVDEFRLKALQEMAYVVPQVRDVIRYAVKEAYTPEIYKAFGQDQEYPAAGEEDARKAGARPDYLMKEWIAHWDLPSSGQGFQMYHRGLITQDQLKLLLKALDVMPFWRDKLIGLSWDIPNRLELRMMARYGLIDRAKLIEILGKGGVAPEYREMIADMNISMGLLTDLQYQYRNKWMNADQVKTTLSQSGMAQEIQGRVYRWIVSNTAGDRTAAEKDLTKAEIVKGVKTGVIEWNAAAQQLVEMGYDQLEAQYILAMNLEVPADTASTELTVRVDTLRRRRRQQLITRDQEIAALLELGLEASLASAYADNDDLRLSRTSTEEGA